MATATEVINRLAARGVVLEADGTDGLRVNGASRLTEQERVALKAHKPAILKALAVSLDNPATTTSPALIAGSTTVIKPSVRECRNCTHFEPYPFEPILGSCYVLKRMQHATSQPRRFGCSSFQPVTGAEVRS